MTKPANLDLIINGRIDDKEELYYQIILLQNVTYAIALDVKSALVDLNFYITSGENKILFKDESPNAGARLDFTSTYYGLHNLFIHSVKGATEFVLTVRDNRVQPIVSKPVANTPITTQPTSKKILPVTGKVYDYEWLLDFLEGELRNKNMLMTSREAQIDSRDRNLFVMTMDSVNTVVNACTPAQKYMPERFDCEDFARTFAVMAILAVEYPDKAGLGIGECFFEHSKGTHCLNLIPVYRNGKVELLFFEPQDKTILKVEDFNKRYLNVKVFRLSF